MRNKLFGLSKSNVTYFASIVRLSFSVYTLYNTLMKCAAYAQSKNDSKFFAVVVFMEVKVIIWFSNPLLYASSTHTIKSKMPVWYGLIWQLMLIIKAKGTLHFIYYVCLVSWSLSSIKTIDNFPPHIWFKNRSIIINYLKSILNFKYFAQRPTLL